jgi:endonuclease/exonuclease/phosphatase family metal-dependent hydrolase
MEPPADDRSVSRRTVLGGIAGATAGVACTTGAAARAGAAQSAPELTVLTRNLSLGVDLFALFEARSLDDVRRIAGDLLSDFDPDRATTRIGAIAAEIETTQPDAVALQEAAALRVQRPSDFGTDSPEPAETVVVDLLDAIQSALAERGLEYEVAASTVTTDVELPAETDDGTADVRLTDRDAVLVRRDRDATATASRTYDAAFEVEAAALFLGLDDLAVRRGFCAADVTVAGETVTVVSTHLSSVSSSLRDQQAAELLDWLPTDRPVIVGGDFNSGPGAETAAYERLTGELTDAYAARHPDRDGFTCCQDGTLRNAESRLNSRVDGLLVRGDVSATAASRVGHRSADRVRYERDGETVQVWPSDHAGVVGTFAITASGSVGTATAAETGTERPTATPAATSASTTGATPDTTAGTGPGLGVLAALAGVAGGVAGRLWRD